VYARITAPVFYRTAETLVQGWGAGVVATLEEEVELQAGTQEENVSADEK
jgi:hypothetical protein